jgi:diadenylate cyclase
MDVKKEVQGTILPTASVNGKVTDEEFYSVLKTISPGTNLRSALDGALKIGKGALIVLENDSLFPLIDGGFRVNCRFTPQKLIELTKMDGAIILSKDTKKINYANVLLTPNSQIKSNETGTRHKAAERTAKETGSLVIAISERKHEITIYYKNLRYQVKSTEEVLRKASTYVQMLEKQRELFDVFVTKLNTSELHNYPSLHQAVNVLQKGRLILKVAEDLKKYMFELGTEGLIIKMRMKEIIAGVEKETHLVVKDYTNLDLKKSKTLIDDLSYDEILDPENILRVLAHQTFTTAVPVKGWRILSKTTLSEADIAKLLKERNSLGEAIYANIQSCTEVLGQDKAKMFKDEIERIKLNAA